MIEGERTVEVGGWLWDAWCRQNGEPGAPAPRAAQLQRTVEAEHSGCRARGLFGHSGCELGWGGADNVVTRYFGGGLPENCVRIFDCGLSTAQPLPCSRVACICKLDI